MGRAPAPPRPNRPSQTNRPTRARLVKPTRPVKPTSRMMRPRPTGVAPPGLRPMNRTSRTRRSSRPAGR
ncbi:hypothetical protein ETD83_40570 [Actinomadura soli]|uniref:Uncharacterized protein n=1 Tax=Actinomadura soli TaxID=2508997 RepID=A0A5C4IYX3_9ACTN|nr:hypothetical protein ETD83_40570 [Actinomadura soli]